MILSEATIKVVLSILWLIWCFFAVQGCPENDKDRDSKMIFAFIVFGVGGLCAYWFGIKR